MWNTDKIICAEFKWVRSIHVLCMLYRQPCCVWSSLCTCRLLYRSNGLFLEKKRKSAVRPADTRTVTLGSILCLCAVHMCCCVWGTQGLTDWCASVYVDTHIETSAAHQLRLYCCFYSYFCQYWQTDGQRDRERRKVREGSYKCLLWWSLPGMSAKSAVPTCREYLI